MPKRPRMTKRRRKAWNRLAAQLVRQGRKGIQNAATANLESYAPRRVRSGE